MNEGDLTSLFGSAEIEQLPPQLFDYEERGISRRSSLGEQRTIDGNSCDRRQAHSPGWSGRDLVRFGFRQT